MILNTLNELSLKKLWADAVTAFSIPELISFQRKLFLPFSVANCGKLGREPDGFDIEENSVVVWGRKPGQPSWSWNCCQQPTWQFNKRCKSVQGGRCQDTERYIYLHYTALPFEWGCSTRTCGNQSVGKSMWLGNLEEFKGALGESNVNFSDLRHILMPYISPCTLFTACLMCLNMQ